MTRTVGVIGNVSIDTARYPDGQTYQLLGGAALHVALAASQAGLAPSPISVVGSDLTYQLRSDPRLRSLDLAHVLAVPGRDCRFDLTYDRDGQVSAVHSDYGIAHALTRHALAVVAGS